MGETRSHANTRHVAAVTSKPHIKSNLPPTTNRDCELLLSLSALTESLGFHVFKPPRESPTTRQHIKARRTDM